MAPPREPDEGIYTEAPRTAPPPPSSRIRRGCCGCPPVRHAKHAPDWQQLPHIKKGYRVGFNLRHTLVSLFTLHNETVNVWSHLLGAVYVGWCLLQHVGGKALLHPIDGTERTALLVFLLSALACLTLSSFYHWWSCGSQRLFELLLRMDFVGIALLIWGSYVPGIHYAFHCFPAYQSIYQTVIVAVAALGMIGAAFTDVNCPKQSAFRTNTFALLVGFGLVPAVHWCFLVPAHVRWMFIDNLCAMFLSYGLGFTFWATHFPESVVPNRFDLYLSSHNIWHLCILVAVVVWHNGLLEYSEALHTLGCGYLEEEQPPPV